MSSTGRRNVTVFTLALEIKKITVIWWQNYISVFRLHYVPACTCFCVHIPAGSACWKLFPLLLWLSDQKYCFLAGFLPVVFPIQSHSSVPCQSLPLSWSPLTGWSLWSTFGQSWQRSLRNNVNTVHWDGFVCTVQMWKENTEEMSHLNVVSAFCAKLRM